MTVTELPFTHHVTFIVDSGPASIVALRYRALGQIVGDGFDSRLEPIAFVMNWLTRRGHADVAVSLKLVFQFNDLKITLAVYYFAALILYRVDRYRKLAAHFSIVATANFLFSRINIIFILGDYRVSLSTLPTCSVSPVLCVVRSCSITT